MNYNIIHANKEDTCIYAQNLSNGQKISIRYSRILFFFSNILHHFSPIPAKANHNATEKTSLT